MLLDNMNLATGDAAMPSAQADPAKPAVLAIIPCLNEAANIRAITGQLLDEANRIPLRIVIADGGSTDGTREIVQSLSAADNRVSFLDNKKRIQSAALNKAVQELGSGAEFLIRVDAHSRYPADYCESLLAERARSGADCVVVSMMAEGRTCFQRAAAAAQNSVLGNGGSAHRMSGGGRFVDHGHHALMRLSAYQSVGGYDETFSHNEDAELDTRFRAAGFKIWLSGAEPIGYFPRRSFRALFSQYFNYGRGRARTVFKHRMRPKLRQSLPLAVAPALLLALLAPLHPIFAVPAASWMAICAGYGLLLGVRERSACVAMSGPAAMVMHFGWSAGFLREAVKHIARRQFGGAPSPGKAASVALQRDGIAS